MKKFIFSFAVALMFVVFGASHASAAVDCSINPCGNGSPEMVVNAWGTTNSQLRHIQPGQEDCPAWFPFYCVDIRTTSYWQSRWGNNR